LDFGDVFYLGKTLEYVRNSDSGTHEVKGKYWLVDMLRQLEEILDDCEIEDEVVSDGVKEWISKLSRGYKRGQKISKSDGKELSGEADRWSELIFKEMCARPCVEFQKGALNQKALVRTSSGKSSAIFEKKVWKALPKIAQSDYSNAAKCLLVGASTPATMVALRGMEAVIRKYYNLKTKKPAGRQNLGNIIDQLRIVKGINKRLIEHMDYIRSEKRNIAQHPNKIYSQREAERIFMEIVSATHDIFA
jgi:hypothetical protein